MLTSPPGLSLPGFLLIQWRLGSFMGRSGLWSQQLQGGAYASSCPVSSGAVRHNPNFTWQLGFRIGINNFMSIFKMDKWKKNIKINQGHFPHPRRSFSVVRLTMNNWMPTLGLFQQDFRGSTMKLHLPAHLHSKFPCIAKPAHPHLDLPLLFHMSLQGRIMGSYGNFSHLQLFRICLF